LATPFFIVFGAWSDKVGRKWIMMAGMFLGIVSYRPIYQYFLDHSDYTTATVVNSSIPTFKSELVKDSQDSLYTVTIAKTLSNRTSYNEVTTTKKFADAAQAPEITTIQQDKKLAQSTFWIFVGLVFYQILLVTMVYGPIAAFLVELFPTQIRYTSMSLPYHIGNGWFGGFLPTTAFAMVAATGDIYYGLWYPVLIAGLSAVVGLFFLPETFKRRLDE
jgi:MFS family permease